MSTFKNGFGIAHTVYALTGDGWLHWYTGQHTRNDDTPAGLAVIAGGPQFLIERVVGGRALAPIVSPCVLVYSEVEGQELDEFQLFTSPEHPEPAELVSRLLRHVAVDQPIVAERAAQYLGFANVFPHLVR